MVLLAEITGVLNTHRALISIFLIAILIGLWISIPFLKGMTGHAFTSSEYVSLGMSAWLIPLLLMALPASRLLQVSDLLFRVITLFFLAAILWLLKPSSWKPAKIQPIPWLLLILLFMSIAANLIFLSKILFPAYFDSPEHFRIIKVLLQGPGQWPTESYYHIGYHLILAAIVKLTGASIIDVMLVGGQILLSTLALPLFFIISRETGSGTSALFTAALAAFGWYMPGHALNWGKYPALFGVSVTLLVLSFIYLIFKDPHGWLNLKKMTLLLIALAACGILHSRGLVACGLFATALFLAGHWDRSVGKVRWSIFAAFLLFMIISSLLLRTDGTFAALFLSYLENDLPSLGLLLFLGIFAIWKFPRLTFALLIFISLICLALYVRVNGLFGYPNLYLLDRPYAQIMLHIPFSFMAGLGLAGLLQVTSPWTVKSAALRRLIPLVAFLAVAVNAIFYQKYDPSSCCKLAGTDDLAAFSWIQNELPMESRLLIATQNLSFTPDTAHVSQPGIDAGLWMNPMTERGSIPFPTNTDFSQPGTLMELCARGVDYIYRGNQPASFNESGLITKPEWYQVAFMLPEVKIYQVIGCPRV